MKICIGDLRLLFGNRIIDRLTRLRGAFETRASTAGGPASRIIVRRAFAYAHPASSSLSLSHSFFLYSAYAKRDEEALTNRRARFSTPDSPHSSDARREERMPGLRVEPRLFGTMDGARPATLMISLIENTQLRGGIP